MKLSQTLFSVFFVFCQIESVLSLTIDDVEEICEPCPSGFYKIPGLDNKCYGMIDENMPYLTNAVANCSEKLIFFNHKI